MGYRIGYNGPTVDELLQKAFNFSVVNNGWAKLDSSDSNPADLNTLITPGNYSISFWKNGPVQLITNGPINVCVTKNSSNNTTYQTIYDAGKVYIRSTTESIFTNTWEEKQSNTEIAISETAPQNPGDNYVWIDISGNAPVIKIYKENSGTWVEITTSDLAEKSIYDPQGINQNITEYLEEKIAEANLETAEEEYNKHLVEGEDTGNPIHVTTAEKAKWNSGISEADAQVSIDALKNEMIAYSNTKIEENTTKANNLNSTANADKTAIDNHINNSTIHLTSTQIEAFNNKAPGDHTHLNDGTVKVSTANLTGMVPIERLDPSVLERNFTVSSYSEMMALTKADVQNGDSIYINESHPTAWFVVDDSLLGQEGYKNEEGTISDTSRNWQSVCYGNSKFVTIARISTYFAYSTDGINWTEGTISDTSRLWSSVCYGNGKYVTVASNTNYFAYSTNGINWTEETLPNSRNWFSVCYGNGKFVAVARSTKYFAYSTDGINWTEGIISSTSREWNSVCYGNDKFVAVVYNSNYFAYSTDGITWTEGTLPSSKEWSSVCYGNGKFVAVAYDSNYFAYSTDGINWTEGTISDTSRYWESVCYGNGKFVAVVDGSTYFAYSTDGINWTESTISSTSRYWDSICYGNGKFITVAYDSNYFAYISNISPLGLVQYAAPAKDLTWENITNKPNTLAGYNITNVYTREEINIIYNNIINSLNTIKTQADELAAEITTEIPSDLDTTYTTNLQRAIDLNARLDELLLSLGYDEQMINAIINIGENPSLIYNE